MDSADILELNLSDLSRLIAARGLASSEVVRAALARLELLQDKLNAFITVLPEQALAAAEKADEEIARGHYRGPLHGVPVSIKDMFEMAGVLTTGGSKILAEWVPETDAALVERLRAAGAIILGKTNLDEFGHGGTSTLSHFGPVHNPWDVERIAGGSSGGSAAAVAAGIGPLSYGTETGSSVRRPASYCGITGFKPTFGIISRHGSFRGAWSQDHVGLFARCVNDIALGLDAVAGFDPRDPASVHQEKPAYTARLDPHVKGLRAGVLRHFLDGVNPAVRHAFDAALKVLAGAGCETIDLDVPEISYAAMTSMMTSSAESAGINHQWYTERHHDFVPHVSRGLAVGMTITASEYFTVQRARHRIREALRATFEKVDLIVSPTTSRVAPFLSEGLKGNGDDTRHVSYNQSNLLRYPSMLGLPAISLPSGLDPEGLPIGLQLIGSWFADQTVLNAGFAYQSGTDWHTRRPSIASA
ncbi:MAG TPA: amidase [Candidatus Binatia bacterium]|nr:amidase [Candidatus Binatia bacterium]